MPYEERCNILNWPLLSTRRTYFSLVECYKIVFGLSHLDFQEVFEFATVHSRELITLFINFFKNLQKLTVSNIFFLLE